MSKFCYSMYIYQDSLGGENVTLYDSELKVMEVLWQNGDMKATEICKILENTIGWKRSTSYTVVKKCIDKGYIQRIEPHFVCKAILSKQEACQNSISEVKQKFFSNSSLDLVKTMLHAQELSKEDIAELYAIVENEMRTKN
mgnify:FL=1